MMQWPETSTSYSPPSSDNANITSSTYSSLNNNGTGRSLATSVCGVHPFLWGREEVQQWLKWCISEFSFTDVQIDKFSMNGKALILLKKEDFIERAPSAGDVLYNILQKLLESQNKTSASMPSLSGAHLAEQAVLMNFMMASNPFYAHAALLAGFPTMPIASGLTPRTSLPLTPPTAGSPRPSESAAPEQPFRSDIRMSRSLSESPRESDQQQNSHLHISTSPAFPVHTRCDSSDMRSMQNVRALQPLPPISESVIKSNPVSVIGGYQRKDEQMDMLSSAPRAKNDCRLLWEFISKLLKDPSYTDFIKWENASDYTFRIVNPAQLSKLWGIQKNRTNMTYEKLSRALRYYYRMDIIEKVPGRRLTYRFMRPPHEIKRGQRGAKPGVPRKSRSTDEEVDEINELEAMEEQESELSDDEHRLPSHDFTSSSTQSFFPKVEAANSRDNSNPIDLVSHQRHSELYGSLYDLKNTVITKTEPLTSRLVTTINGGDGSHPTSNPDNIKSEATSTWSSKSNNSQIKLGAENN